MAANAAPVDAVPVANVSQEGAEESAMHGDGTLDDMAVVDAGLVDAVPQHRANVVQEESPSDDAASRRVGARRRAIHRREARQLQSRDLPTDSRGYSYTRKPTKKKYTGWAKKAGPQT